MPEVGWGILGTGAIAGLFAEGLRAVPDARLHAVASREPHPGPRRSPRIRAPDARTVRTRNSCATPTSTSCTSRRPTSSTSRTRSSHCGPGSPSSARSRSDSTPRGRWRSRRRPDGPASSAWRRCGCDSPRRSSKPCRRCRQGPSESRCPSPRSSASPTCPIPATGSSRRPAAVRSSTSACLPHLARPDLPRRTGPGVRGTVQIGETGVDEQVCGGAGVRGRAPRHGLARASAPGSGTGPSIHGTEGVLRIDPPALLPAPIPRRRRRKSPAPLRPGRTGWMRATGGHIRWRVGPWRSAATSARAERDPLATGATVTTARRSRSCAASGTVCRESPRMPLDDTIACWRCADAVRHSARHA